VATISALRETLRSQLGDLARLAGKKRFDNSKLNDALFEGLRQHNKHYKWQDIPESEEQLILLLAKVRLARDKALEYALDARVTTGGGMTTDRNTNAQQLSALANDLRDEYEYQAAKILSQDNVSGDIIIGNLVRDSRLIHAKVPVQLAPPPPKPKLSAVQYRYYANRFVNPPSDQEFQQAAPFGRIVFAWERITPGDLAYLRFYGCQNPRAPLESWQTIRTIYDYYSDTLAFERVSGPWISTGEAQMAKQELWHDITLLPTGVWYFALAAVNWNMLATLSEIVQLQVENRIDLLADTLILEV
jgi:hypothetical protein